MFLFLQSDDITGGLPQGIGFWEWGIYILAKEKEDENMGRRKEECKQNNFNGNINFTGQTQIAAGDIINNISEEKPKTANYTPEPKWRSPFTLAVLTWISTILAIAGMFPVIKIVKSMIRFFSGVQNNTMNFDVQKYSILFVIFVFLFLIFFSFRRIAKRQTRHPLFFNFAISGYGNRLTIEKIHTEECPQCGGKMKYYNKPIEWREILRSDGSIKREVTKRIPVLECKRNAEHWYPVDPAGDKIK